MRKIREVLRLYFAAALSIRAIARSLGTSPSTVGDYLRRAKVAGLGWPLPESVDDTGLERRLFPLPPPSCTARPLPDWSEVHRELRRKSVTLSLLWQEYKETHPEGLQYSRFCEQYRAWAAKLDLVMRQEHRAGEKLFVDYAGQTVPVVDRETGGERQAQICSECSGGPCTLPDDFAGWPRGVGQAAGSTQGVPVHRAPEKDLCPGGPASDGCPVGSLRRRAPVQGPAGIEARPFDSARGGST